MNGPDERLDPLFSAQDRADSILQAVQTLLGKQESSPCTVCEQDSTPSGQTISFAETDATTGKEPASPSFSTFAMLLPQILQAMSGNTDLIRKERVALLHAMRPYMKQNRLSNLDRALRIANITKATASALKRLGGD